MDLLLADWVFAYGSLIWNPEFEYDRAQLGRVHGYHRAFCIRSSRYRGTPETPGVVLGLDRGGSCVGLAYRLPRAARRRAIGQLYEREMSGRVYVPTLVTVRLAPGERVRALTFVADRRQDSWLKLAESQILARLQSCTGERGANRDYAINTWQSLRERGVRDARLERLIHRLGSP